MPTSEQPRSRPGSDASELRPARVVVADDDRLTRDLLAGILRSAGHTVEAVEDGQEVLERVAGGGVDLVLLDLVMPRLGGLEACRILKGMTADGFLPVVLVTVRTDTQSRVEGLRIGADDYVCKPFDEQELLARITAMLRIKKLHDQVANQRAKFEKLSVHDEMTGLYNYRYLNTRLNEEFKRAERYHEPFACIVVDIDQLRILNDTGGRALGDATICYVADGIRRCVRDVDVVARYGGEEFLIVLPSTHFAGSVVVAERIWREVSGKPIDVDWEARRGEAPGTIEPSRTGVGDGRLSVTNEGGRGSFTNEGRGSFTNEGRGSITNEGRSSFTNEAKSLEPRPRRDTGRDLDVLLQGRLTAPVASDKRPFTVSIGVALYPSRDVRTKDALLRAADSALSQAKREGGNRICVFQQQGYIYTPTIGAARDATTSDRKPRAGVIDPSRPESARTGGTLQSQTDPEGSGRKSP